MPDEAPEQDQQTSATEEKAESAAWTPPASQEEFDRIIQDRLRRATKKFSDYDSVKEKAGRLDALENEMATEAEKQVRAAREEERKQANDQFVPRLVKAEFRANRGALSDDQLSALLEDLNLARYVGDDGEPDTEKIRAKVAAIAPAETKREPFPDMGGGKRGGTSTTTNMSELIRRAAGHGV